MRASPPRRTRVFLLPLLLASGCRVGPDYQAPDLSGRTDAPWRPASGPAITAEREDLGRWWEHLGSPELSALAARLCAQNLSLAEARQRLVAARARRDVVGAGRRPQVAGGVDVTRAGTGDESLNFQGPPPGQELTLYSTSVGATWELDLWGRVERLLEAAEAEVGIALEDARGVEVSLLAELALAYVDASTLGQRLAVARRGIELQQETARLARSRVEAGNGARLELEQAERELQLGRARVPELELALRAAQNRIAVLVGERPRAGLVEAQGELTLPPAVGLGLPADLLVRRTDVRRAERALAAAVARIGAAEAERYPDLSISGRIALAARDLDVLTRGADALSYSIGPHLSIPLFTGGRLANEVRLREAGAEQARIAFERTLLEALAEVETAGEGVVRTRQRVESLEAAAAAARSSAELAQELHDAGLRGLLQVVDAQRARVAVEDQLLVARQSALARTIDLYRALGGGWEAGAGALEEPSGTRTEESSP